MRRLKATFAWRYEAGDGKLSKVDASSIRQTDRITALDFLSDIISEAQELYNDILISPEAEVIDIQER